MQARVDSSHSLNLLEPRPGIMSMYDPDGPFGGMPLPRGPYDKKKQYNAGFVLPPEVKPWRIFGTVIACMVFVAVPIWGVPWWEGREPKVDPENPYVKAKNQFRGARRHWMESDTMPEK